MQFIRSIVVVLSLCLSTVVSAKFHFTEIYSENEMWRVDHFTAAPNRLQDLLETKTFKYEYEARAFEKKVTALNFGKRRTFAFASSELNVAPLWKVSHEWNDEWEAKYAVWVEKNLDVEFFSRNNFPTDCADVAYAIRWIFSREHGLPAAATLAGSNVIATHLSAKESWNNLPGHKDWSKDKRFLAGLNWLLNGVYTKTLYKDGFPVKLSRKNIKPGLINLLGGHTELFNKVSYIEGEIPLEVVSSTAPRLVRDLSSRIFMDPEVTAETDGGLLQFRWPVLNNGKWDMIPKEQMAEFSHEQYKEDLCDKKHFTFCLLDILDAKFDPKKIVKKLTDSIEQSILNRISIVNEGWSICQGIDCSPGSAGYEDWGTPSRDKRLLQHFWSASGTASSLNMDQEFMTWHEKAEVQKEGIKVKVSTFISRLSSGFVSYDPRDSVGIRWAMTVGDIKTYVAKVFLDSQDKRAALIAKATLCRQKPDVCKNSTSMFAELSTYEIDSSLRRMISSYLSLCSNEVCEEKMLTKMKRVFFQSPAPWDEEIKRTAEDVSVDDLHFLPSSHIQQAGPHFLILSSLKLYNIRDRKYHVLPEEIEFLFYNKINQQIIAHTPRGLKFFDHDFNFQQELLIDNFASYSKHDFLNGNILYISFQDKLDFFIVNLESASITDKGSYKEWSTDYASQSVVISGDSNILFSTEGGRLKRTPLKWDPSISLKSILKFDEKRFFLDLSNADGENRQRLILEDGVLSPIRADITYIYRSIGDFIQGSRSDGEIDSDVIFDESFNLVLNHVMSTSSSPNMEEQILWAADLEGRSKTYYFSEKGLRPIRLSAPENSYFQFIGPSSAVLLAEAGYTTYSFDGDLKTSKYSYDGDCTSGNYTSCFSPEISYSYNNYSDSNVSRVFLEYKSDVHANMPYLLNAAYGVYTSTNVGEALSVADNLTLWFAE